MMKLTVEEEKSIQKAHDLVSEIDRLYDEMDLLLSPVCTKDLKDKNWIEFLITKIPRGFYRSELRVLLKTLK